MMMSKTQPTTSTHHHIITRFTTPRATITSTREGRDEDDDLAFWFEKGPLDDDEARDWVLPDGLQREEDRGKQEQRTTTTTKSKKTNETKMNRREQQRCHHQHQRSRRNPRRSTRRRCDPVSPLADTTRFASWAVQEGAKINAGDILAEIQTDKATMEMECMDNGYLAKILVQAGEADDIPIGRAIAVTCENEEDVGKFADYVAEDTVGTTASSDNSEASSASVDEPTAKAILERPEYEAIKKGDLTRNSRAAGRDLEGSKDEDLDDTATASKLPEDSPSMTVRDALNSALSEEMTRDEKVFIIGEEVGEYQGAYKITKGLHQKFGAERVRDTPITEAGFTGMACGAAFMGLKPVVEFMTFNFALQSIDHIVNSAAKTLYMSAGTISCPIVFRGPEAGPASAHSTPSASPPGMSIPGLKVLAPYDAEDARGLMKAAIRDPDPVVFLENELLYGESFQLPKEALDEDFTIEIGKAKIMREGSDVTFVAFSKMVGYCLKAAEELEKDGVRAEVINLRSLRPFDREAVARSAKKTGRVVIVEEGWPQCGVGSEIAACVNEDAFDYLDAPSKESRASTSRCRTRPTRSHGHRNPPISFPWSRGLCLGAISYGMRAYKISTTPQCYYYYYYYYHFSRRGSDKATTAAAGVSFDFYLVLFFRIPFLFFFE